MATTVVSILESLKRNNCSIADSKRLHSGGGVMFTVHEREFSYDTLYVLVHCASVSAVHVYLHVCNNVEQ